MTATIKPLKLSIESILISQGSTDHGPFTGLDFSDAFTLVESQDTMQVDVNPDVLASDATPEPVALAGAAGTSDLFSRSDHVHAGAVSAMTEVVVTGTSVNAAKSVQNVLLEDNKSYFMRIDAIGSQVAVQANASWSLMVTCHTHAGAVVIDDVLIQDGSNGTTWTVTVVNSVGLNIGVKFIGGLGVTVNFSAVVTYFGIAGV